jgi:NMT1/THI5 like
MVGKKVRTGPESRICGQSPSPTVARSGETPFVIASGSGTFTSHVLGLKDQVIVALLSNKLGGGIFSKSEIKRPEELKGKLIATGRPGTLNDLLVRYVLTRKWGLSPYRDVKLMPIGEPPLMMQVLERGVVDATSLSVPANFVAKSKDFFELVNYDNLGLSYQIHAVTTVRTTIGKNPQLVERVLKALVEVVAVFKSNKEKSFRRLAQIHEGREGGVYRGNPRVYQHGSGSWSLLSHPIADAGWPSGHLNLRGFAFGQKFDRLGNSVPAELASLSPVDAPLRDYRHTYAHLIG